MKFTRVRNGSYETPDGMFNIEREFFFDGPRPTSSPGIMWKLWKRNEDSLIMGEVGLFDTLAEAKKAAES